MSPPDGPDLPIAHRQALVGSDTLAALRPRTCPADTILFRAGDPDDVLYIVLSGEIALVTELAAPDERVVHVRSADAIIGEMAVFSQSVLTHRLSGRALVDTQVLAIPRADVDALLRREPLLAYELLRVASGHMHHAHKHTMRKMEAKNAQLAQAYDALRAAQSQLLEHERLQHELRLARELQEQMLPDVLPQVPGIDLGASIIPAREVSGDFFDLFLLDDQTLGIVIGDVCGKGMAAALYMAQTRSLLRAAAGMPEPPAQVLRLVNRLLRDMNSGSMFVTGILARLHLPTRTMVAARAGHEYPLIYAADGTPRLQPRAVGQPLGILEDPAIDVQQYTLAPGETLLLYTDGVTEAADPTGAFFECERLHAAVCSAQAAATAQGLCDHIVQRLTTFQGVAPQADDITLVAVRAT
ncbi:MAG: SpoIIE family protein phosphatase [Chloroflexales bacterium]|nr:SpoIIE family protein phosphatase [Chloroflexales bacterium]